LFAAHLKLTIKKGRKKGLFVGFRVEEREFIIVPGDSEVYRHRS